MRTPPTFVIFRAITVAITAGVLLLFGLGLGGRGPLNDLGSLASHAVSWVQDNTGVAIR
jgi:hypothetical protein